MKTENDKLDCPQCGVFLVKNSWPGTREYTCPICKGTWTPATEEHEDTGRSLEDMQERQSDNREP